PRRHLRIVLRRLAAIGHAVIANYPDPPVAQATFGRRLGNPSLRRHRILPRDEEQPLAWRVDALENLPIDNISGLGEAEIVGKIAARGVLLRNRGKLADRDRLARADGGLIETLLHDSEPFRRDIVRDDL